MPSTTSLSRRAPQTAAALGAVLAFVLIVPPSASADVTIGANVGYFALRGIDDRGTNDVIWRNLDFLAFDSDDFNGFTFGGDVYVGLGKYFEAGGGVAYYSQTVPSVYRDYVDRDGSEIEQDLRLRIVPITAAVRIFPFSREVPVQPYLGAGVAWLAWKYNESGEFVDFTDFSVFRDTFSDSGTAVAPLLFGGVRVSIGDGVWVGGEFRWHDATVDLDRSQGFAGDELNLGGYTWLGTFHIRF